MAESFSDRRSTRPSRYAQLVGTTVADLDTVRRERLSSVTEETDADGKRRLFIRFPTPHSRESIQTLEVSNWLMAPELAVAFAEMVVVWGGDKTELSRQTFINDLNHGFFQYLARSDTPTPSLATLNTGFINGFIEWLGRMEDGAYVLAAYTRLHYLGAVRSVVSHLKKSKQYRSQLSKDLHIRRNPWPGASRQIAHPTKIIEPADWIHLHSMCMEACTQIMQTVEQGWMMLTEESPEPNSLASHLQRLDALFPTVIGSFVKLQELDAPLARQIGTPEALAALRTYFHPSPRDLVPFLLLLAMVSFFSGETLFATRRSDVSYIEIQGVKRLIWRPYKSRSRRRQHRSFPISDAPDSPTVLIPFIERWTARIRPVATPRLQEWLFIWIPVNKPSEPHGFESKSGGSKGAWQNHLSAFLIENELPHLTLRQVRTTGLDNVHTWFDGDLQALQAVSGHQNPEVLLSHYTSDAARKRHDERLGDVMTLRSRWRETDGTIDPRTLPPKQDLAAATPGWRCFDPYVSPVPGQDKGKLCSAYGACPGCALAHVNLQDGYALARVLQLKVKIEQAQTLLPAARWLTAWAPRLQRLIEYWLPRFQDETVIREAAQWDLDDLPELE